MKKRILFRADAGAEIGYGHFIRTLALADMLKEDFECVFYTQTPSEYQRRECKKVCHLVELPADETRFDLFLDGLKGDEIVVLDNYFFTTDYQKEIKAKGCKLVCIDDMHDKHYVADAVINHGLSDPSLFDVESNTKLYLGFEYALLRAPFLKQVSHKKRRNNDAVISFGGADPLNITERTVSLLLKMKIPYNLVVILGDKGYLSNCNKEKVTLKRNLTAEQMANLFKNSAVGIFSASSVCIEALSLGLPVIVGYFVENQKEFYGLLEKGNSVQPIGFLPTLNTVKLAKALNSIENVQNYKFPCGIKQRFVELFYNI